MIKDLMPPLRAFLLADGAIAAMVVTTNVARVFPSILKQGELRPSIVYHSFGTPGDYHTEGPSGLVVRRVQLNAWAQNAADAFHLANLIKFRIDGHRGTMQTAASPPAIVPVQGVFFDYERSDYASDIKMHTMQRDYLVTYEER